MDTTASLLREVKRAVRAEKRAAEVARDTQAARDQAIRAAMAAKVPVQELVEVTGLTRARLGQIRAGRRTLAKQS